MAKYGKKTQAKVRKVMRERKEGKLRSGGSHKKVKSRKQAIAIALSEARREGDKVPPNPRRASRKTTKKSAAKKTRKSAAKKRSPRKSTAKKSSSRKSSAKKTTRKSPARKSTRKAARKSSGRKSSKAT